MFDGVFLVSGFNCKMLIEKITVKVVIKKIIIVMATPLMFVDLKSYKPFKKYSPSNPVRY